MPIGTACTQRGERCVLGYARSVQVGILLIAGVLGVAAAACGSSTAPSSQATVRVVFIGATTRRADLPPAAQACVDGVGATHIHPSWRNFASSPLQAVPPDRYEITLNDAPVNTRLSFRVNDQNSCDQNPTGAVTRNILVNDVRLLQNTTTPGNGDEPGYAFVVAPDGAISQP
jgi:hypothetical protein